MRVGVLLERVRWVGAGRVDAEIGALVFHCGSGWTVIKVKCRPVWPSWGSVCPGRSFCCIGACKCLCMSAQYMAGDDLVEEALAKPSRRLPLMVGCVRPRFR